ncbi:hypothetical protein C8Q75DRAFT_97569 [Abortiporus biennis]|nr:hypothetical protein C8Q75DRAFT_97569 [Abortiporus biennis]
MDLFILLSMVFSYPSSLTFLVHAFSSRFFLFIFIAHPHPLDASFPSLPSHPGLHCFQSISSSFFVDIFLYFFQPHFTSIFIAIFYTLHFFSKFVARIFAFLHFLSFFFLFLLLSFRAIASTIHHSSYYSLDGFTHHTFFSFQCSYLVFFYSYFYFYFYDFVLLHTQTYIYTFVLGSGFCVISRSGIRTLDLSSPFSLPFIPFMFELKNYNKYIVG